MSFFLYIMRHAKSDWNTGQADFDRPLNRRGIRNARRMGKWLVENRYVPEQVLCSSAERAKQTWRFVSNQIKAPGKDPVIYDQSLYLADAGTLLDKILLYKSGVNSLLLIAHNPGLDYLVNQLSRNSLSLSASGKLMTTAALAIFEYTDSAFDPDTDKPLSMQLVRPKELN